LGLNTIFLYSWLFPLIISIFSFFIQEILLKNCISSRFAFPFSLGAFIAIFQVPSSRFSIILFSQADAFIFTERISFSFFQENKFLKSFISQIYVFH
jgi:hypothetical protein